MRAPSLLMATLLLLGVLPAGAGEPSPGASPGERPVRVAEVLAEAGDPEDPATAGRASRALIEDHWGLELPARADADGGEDAAYTSREGLPIGDLNGDGVSDVLSYETAFDSYLGGERTYSVRALGGAEGQVLWSRSYPGRFELLPLPAGDVNGDGRGDVLVLTRESRPEAYGPCSSQLCVQVGYDRPLWMVAMLSGADGSTLWERETRGVTVAAGQNFAVSPPGATFGSDHLDVRPVAALLPLMAGDRLVLNTFDTVTYRQYRYHRLEPELWTEVPHYAIGTRAEVLDAATGEQVHERTRLPEPGEALLLPLSSEGGDLLWSDLEQSRPPNGCLSIEGEDPRCTDGRAATLTLERIDGETLDSIWEQQVGVEDMVDAFLRLPGGDLDGDGTPDVVVFEAVAGEDDPRVWTIGVVSGADGSVRWRRDVVNHPNPLDGTVLGRTAAGTAILLTVDGPNDMSTRTVEFQLRRVDAATGEVVHSTERTVPLDGHVLTLEPMGDVDGDGIRDLLVSTSSIDNSRPPAERRHNHVEIHSGLTGAQLFHLLSIGNENFRSAGDLHGEGQPALLGLRTPLGANDQIAISPLRLRDSKRLWARVHPQAALAVRELSPADGAARSDLLVSRNAGGHTKPAGRIEVLDGRTGDVRWAYGAELED